MLKLNNTVLKNQWVKEEIEREMLKKNTEKEMKMDTPHSKIYEILQK